MLRQYNRQVITLKQERTGYGIRGKEPFGRCTIEARENNLKILLNLQNLKANNYKVYFVSVKDTKSTAVFIGNIRTDESGKCEAKFLKDADDVEQTNMSIEEFNTVIVMEAGQKELLVPLVGYWNEVLRWKNNFTIYRHDEVSAKKVKETEIKNETEVNTIEKEEIIKEEKIIEEEIIKEEKVIEEETIKEEKVIEEEIIKEEKEIEEEEFIKEEKEGIEDERYFEKVDVFMKKEELVLEGQLLQEEKQEKEKNNKYADEYEYYKIDSYYNTEGSNEVQTKRSINIQNEHLHKPMPDTVNAPLRDAEQFELNDKHVHNDSSQMKKDNLDIDFILQNNIKMQPFKKQNKIVHWVRISLEELIYLPFDKWQYLNNPLILSAYKTNKHLIFGKIENASNEYYLGIPEQYREEDKKEAHSLGFKQFKCCDDIEEKEGAYGYWLMKVVY